eukprot:GHVU01172656.1.p1 GENE.GHVU01172656.1~~GHVU01172656.1.p1  ORF type:complete len:293 (-),score=53.30 GHVU01172656.1:287-1165(-)
MAENAAPVLCFLLVDGHSGVLQSDVRTLSRTHVSANAVVRPVAIVAEVLNPSSMAALGRARIRTVGRLRLSRLSPPEEEREKGATPTLTGIACLHTDKHIHVAHDGGGDDDGAGGHTNDAQLQQQLERLQALHDRCNRLEADVWRLEGYPAEAEACASRIPLQTKVQTFMEAFPPCTTTSTATDDDPIHAGEQREAGSNKRGGMGGTGRGVPGTPNPTTTPEEDDGARLRVALHAHYISLTSFASLEHHADLSWRYWAVETQDPIRRISAATDILEQKAKYMASRKVTLEAA